MMPTVKGRRADHTAHAVHHQTHPRVVWASADPELRDEVAHILAEDFEVIDVPDGATALQAVHEHLPELVLSDVGMPHVDGFGLLVALRADPRTCSPPSCPCVGDAHTLTCDHRVFTWGERRGGRRR